MRSIRVRGMFGAGMAALLLVASVQAWAQSLSGDALHATGVALLKTSAVLAASLPDQEREVFLNQVATVQFLVGDREAAAATILSAVSTFNQRVAVAHHNPQWSQAPSRRDCLGSLPLRFARQALDWASAQADKKEFDAVRAWVGAAQALLPELADDEERAQVLPDLSRLLFEAGDTVGAQSALDAAISAGAENPRNVNALVKAMVAEGNSIEALALAREKLGSGSYVTIVTALAMAGDLAAARQTARDVLLPGHPYSLIALAEAECKAGAADDCSADFAAALAAQPSDPDRSESVAMAEARAGRLDQAMVLLTGTSPSPRKGQNFETLGLIAAKRKQPNLARRAFAAARQVDLDDKEGFPAAVTLGQLAVFQFQAGDRTGAAETADLLDTAARQRAMTQFARFVASSGDVGGARKIMADAGTPGDGPIQDAIALGEARNGNLGQALRLAQPTFMAEIFRNGCPPARLNFCLAAVRTLPDPGEQARAMFGIAQSLLGVTANLPLYVESCA